MSDLPQGIIQRAQLHSDLVDTRCMALNRDGTRCRGKKVTGMDFCAAHSNINMIRIERGEEGRYVGYAGDLEKNYQGALQDKYLLHLRDEIAILDARTKDLLKQARTGVNEATWKIVIKQFEILEGAMRADDPMTATKTMHTMKEAITAARLDIDLWHNIERLLETRRRLVETEQKYLVQSNQMISTEAAMVMLSSVITAVKKAVKKYVANPELEEASVADAGREYESIVGSRQNSAR